MGIFNAVSEWRKGRYQKRISKMQSQGKCPDCEGHGINPLMLEDHFYADPIHCPGCNGSGLFSDWTLLNQQ